MSMKQCVIMDFGWEAKKETYASGRVVVYQQNHQPNQQFLLQRCEETGKMKEKKGRQRSVGSKRATQRRIENSSSKRLGSGVRKESLHWCYKAIEVLFFFSYPS